MIKKISFIDLINVDDEIKQKVRLWRNQNFVRKKMFNQNIISSEEHNRFLEKLNHDYSNKYFVAFLNGQPFGVLYYYLREENILEFGYYLIDEKYVNSGLGVVLEYILLNYGFDNLNVDKVFCRTLITNKKVVSLHSKFGFKTEKILEKFIKIDDIYRDVCHQAIYPGVWRDTRKKIEGIVKYIIPLENVEKLKEEE